MLVMIVVMLLLDFGIVLVAHWNTSDSTNDFEVMRLVCAGQVLLLHSSSVTCFASAEVSAVGSTSCGHAQLLRGSCLHS